ncbi:MAG TPA: hypothetical protein VMD92_01935 [Acidobacteriaceae bacterium]|nr:hypothetical protein [Acidobacteriaceae bacterium]
MGHKLLALLIAAGIAWGGHVWLQRRAALNAYAAQLSFDARAARTIDAGLATIHDPAVVLAQSVLTDSVVERLSASAPLATASVTSRLGEFRAHLQLTQSSPSTLNVRFLGAGNTPSDATADTVAQAIAKWTFSRYGAPLVPSPAPVQTAPPPAGTALPEPAKSAAAPQISPNSSSPNSSALAASLGDLDALLSSTKRDLDNIAFSGADDRHPRDPARYRESDQQHLLKARVAAAERKIDEIRSSAAARDLPRAAAAQLAEIQHAVASILSAGEAGAYGFRNVGVDAAEVRRERAQLDDAIATVHRDSLALQQEVSAQAGSSGDTASSTPPPAATSTASPPPPQDDAAQAAQPPATADLLPNPFTFAHSAAAPAPILWWPTVAAGLFCGLFYWILAALPNREPYYGQQDMPEPIFTGRNMITPPTSPSPRQEPEAVPQPAPQAAVTQPAPQAAPALVSLMREEDDSERHPRRASFRFEPAGPEVSPPVPVAAQQEPAPEDLDASQDVASAEELPSPQPVPAPPLAAADPVPVGETQRVSLPEAHFLTPNALTRPREAQEKSVSDTWTHDLRKALAQTDIGRRLEKTPGAEPPAERDGDAEPRPARTDGLAS